MRRQVADTPAMMSEWQDRTLERRTPGSGTDGERWHPLDRANILSAHFPDVNETEEE